MHHRTLTRRALAATVLALTAGTAAWAQNSDWPTAPIRIVAPAPPGGSLDRLSRMLGEELGKSFGQAVVVENRPGAGGSIGTQAVAAAPADGYTLLSSGVFNAITPSLMAKLPFNYLQDFTHIALLMHGPNVLVARPDFPHDNLASLVAAARKDGNALNFGSAGNGTSGHLTMEMFQRAAGVQLTHVPYKGMAPAMQDLLGGQISMMATNQDAVLPLVKSGKLKAIAVTSARRNPAFPNVPTFVEAGFADVVVTSWGALAVRKDTPAPVVQRLRDATLKALQLPHIRQPLEADGWVFFDMPPSQFEAFVRGETERWSGIVKAAGLKAQ